MFYNTIQYNKIQYSAVPYSTVQYSTVQSFHDMICHAMLLHIMSCTVEHVLSLAHKNHLLKNTIDNHLIQSIKSCFKCILNILQFPNLFIYFFFL